MSFVTHAMCLDAHEELIAAWRAIRDAQEPRRAQALAVLQDLTVLSYDEVNGRIRRVLASKDSVDERKLARELTAEFRAQYARAAALARGE